MKCKDCPIKKDCIGSDMKVGEDLIISCDECKHWWNRADEYPCKNFTGGTSCEFEPAGENND